MNKNLNIINSFIIKYKSRYKTIKKISDIISSDFEETSISIMNCKKILNNIFNEFKNILGLNF
jgi:hypothetical protein